MISVAVIGIGYWGKKIIRNLEQSDRFKISCVIDSNEQEKSPYKKFNQFNDALKECSFEAVIIATPIESHYSFCKLAILAKKHVLVEKPLCTSTIEALELKSLSIAYNVKLFIDFTFLYTPEILKLKSLIKNDSFGKLNKINSIRANRGPFLRFANVIQDLAPHDISIFNFLSPSPIIKIDLINGKEIFNNQIEEVNYELTNNNGVKLKATNSWLFEKKTRIMELFFDKATLIYDDTSPRKLIIKESNEDISYEKAKEPLLSLIHAFYDVVKNKRSLISNINLGVQMTEVFESLDIQYKNKRSISSSRK